MIMIIIFGVISVATADNGEVRVSAPIVQFASTDATANVIHRSIPPCRVFDSTGGRYGKGVPIPNYPCISLAYAPYLNNDVIRIMQKVATL